MRDIFVISDTHFSHANILNFRNDDGTFLRPDFASVDEMNEKIIENWNKTVQPADVVYHLGDFTFGGKHNIARLAPRLMGRKRLIMGNHDYDAKDYIGHFEKIMSWRQFGTDTFKRPVFLCHYPLHRSAFDYRVDGGGSINVHGHLHQKLSGESYHVNVCVEHTNYTPVSIEAIVDKFDEKKR